MHRPHHLASKHAAIDPHSPHGKRLARTGRAGPRTLRVALPLVLRFALAALPVALPALPFGLLALPVALLALPVALLAPLPALPAGEAPPFRLERGTDGIRSLRRSGDPQDVEFIAAGRVLGPVVVRYRERKDADGRAGGSGTDAAPGESRTSAGPEGSGTDAAATESRMDATPRGPRTDAAPGGSWTDAAPGGPAAVTSRFTEADGALRWEIAVRNGGDVPLEIGDIALPLPLNTVYPRIGSEEDRRETFTRRLIRHSFVAGEGSFIFWLPVGGIGPHLVMTPLAGTRLESFEEPASDYAHGGAEYVAYVRSAARGAAETRGTWRQPHTASRLEPGAEASFGFDFRWADSLEGVRDVIHGAGGVDIHVVPGMVVPEDLDALVALRVRGGVERIEAEFPDDTSIAYRGEPLPDTHVYEVRMQRRGENLLTVRWAGGRRLPLEFLVTPPLETLIRKRAAFIAGRQQHRDPSRWYDGLWSLWDVRMPEGRNLLGPEDLGGQHVYAVSGSDDPCTGKPVYLSEKNVAWPEAKEIESLEYFVERFVWGKHQRTDAERPFPYGIYGADSWRENRFSERDPLEGRVSRPGGPSACRMWRTFDYPHYFVLYYNLYRIAKRCPHLVRHLDARGYLERAYGTARAFFEVPYSIRMEGGWSFSGWTDWAYTMGNFHEKYIVAIMDALETEGMREEAAWLRGEWEKKVKYFIYDDPFPFISEMPVDSTAYESTYAFARYALERGLSPDEKLWQDRNTGRWYSHPEIDPARHEEFLRRQLLANLACRGWLEAGYPHLGSDFRGCGSSFYTLSYMSQMGGWAILDQALRFEPEPATLARIGYASMLSSWALVRFDDGPHEGSAGWGFMPQKFGADWCPAVRGIPRGPWPVDGEVDHGLAAYVETAATVVVDDPIFGRFAYGGVLEGAADAGTSPGGRPPGEIRVLPRDGVRQRLFVRAAGLRLDLELDRDGFAAGLPIEIREDLSRISFAVENRCGGAHEARIVLRGLPAGDYEIHGGGARAVAGRVDRDGSRAFPMSVPEDPDALQARFDIRRRAP